MIVGIAVSEVALWGRRQQAKASRRDGYLQGVLSTASRVASGTTSANELVQNIAGQIVDVLQIDECRYVEGEPADDAPRLEDDGSVLRDGHPVKVERDGLPADIEIALMVRSGGAVLGHFVLIATDRIYRPSLEQRTVAAALANQAGAALATMPT